MSLLLLLSNTTSNRPFVLSVSRTLKIEIENRQALFAPETRQLFADKENRLLMQVNELRLTSVKTENRQKPAC